MSSLAAVVIWTSYHLSLGVLAGVLVAAGMRNGFLVALGVRTTSQLAVGVRTDLASSWV